MIEIKQNTYKGTRILVGNDKRVYINKCIELLQSYRFTEIQLPNIQMADVFSGKVGEENQHMMFRVKDQSRRKLVLAPEYTAVVQQLAQTTYKHQKDVCLFYVQECYRGEKPQGGRYRQFTQLGVEVLNPDMFINHKPMLLQSIAMNLCWLIKKDSKKLFEYHDDVTRGLDYYKEGKGFEITCSYLGSSNQVCGGGEYDNGMGFAIGVDRIINLL